MIQPKIQGKFYPLQNHEWARACKELTPAQRDVLYHIRTLDPYGNGISLGVTETGKHLGLDKSTVSRALKALDQKGWIDLELIQVSVKIRTGCELSVDNSVASEQQALPVDNSVACTQQARSLRNNQVLEPLPDKDSSTSKIFRSYLEFKKSLSESERKEFLDFGKRQAEQMPRKPRLPLKWIERNFEELWQQFQARGSGGSPIQEIDPPGPEDSDRLNALKQQRSIQDWFLSTDGHTKAVLPNATQIPWREAIATFTLQTHNLQLNT